MVVSTMTRLALSGSEVIADASKVFTAVKVATSQRTESSPLSIQETHDVMSSKMTPRKGFGRK